MQQRQYAQGNTIFREGERSDAVCLVVQGSVDVIKEDGPKAVLLGRIGEGEFVGEMGVVSDRPRSATVRAVDEVTVEWISKDDFLRRIAENSETALHLIRRLSERLNTLDQAFSEAVSSGPSVSPTDGPLSSRAQESERIVIFADAPALEDALPPDGLIVESYPFSVGRRSMDGGPKPDLALKDTRPYRLSRAHFAIHRTEDGLRVRDLLSKLGTSVNGAFLGDLSGKDSGLLVRGENSVVAGGVDSPFRFRVVW